MESFIGLTEWDLPDAVQLDGEGDLARSGYTFITARQKAKAKDTT